MKFVNHDVDGGQSLEVQSSHHDIEFRLQVAVNAGFKSKYCIRMLEK